MGWEPGTKQLEQLNSKRLQDVLFSESVEQFQWVVAISEVWVLPTPPLAELSRAGVHFLARLNHYNALGVLFLQ